MLRPIDMAITVQYAADAARASTNQTAARPEVAQQQFTERLEKQVKMQEKQVQNANEAEKNEVNPDRKGHGGGYQPRKKPGQKKPEAKQSKPKFHSESMYDIKI